ncbi:MAG: carboxypeptidase-like regulatory domain-containing protein [Candidatus Gracilibacteria bacterium]|nr:carboxypeptidase-like regulatory domain-containing protein [Candidatus Gracilibacteria bacterium]
MLTKKSIIFSALFLFVLLGICTVLTIVNKDSKNLEEDNSQIKSDILQSSKIIYSKEKEVDITKKDIDPNKYETLNEFIHYFNMGSGISLSVNLEEEPFYIKTGSGKNTIIKKIDNDTITNVDKNSDKNIKNIAINEIFQSYLNDNYVYGEPNGTRNSVRFLENNELPSNLSLHNQLLSFNSGESFYETKKRLENISNKSKEDYLELSYIYDYAGLYDKANLYKKISGTKKLNYTIKGKVFNSDTALKGATISLLNNTTIKTTTNNDGEYTLNFETYPETRIRLRASYLGLSDGFNGTYIIFDYDNQEATDVNFNLHKYDTKNELDTSKIQNGAPTIIKSSLGNTFEINKDSIIYKDGKTYSGKFITYIYEFNKDTPGMDNFLSLDSFNNSYGLEGNMMITNGMTYLLITDTQGNELYISKKNPIKTQQYMDIKNMMNIDINGTKKLTESEIDLILEKSKEGGYPINYEFLRERNITGFSPWWVLNIKKGIRENSGIKLINKKGLKEGLYYNID